MFIIHCAAYGNENIFSLVVQSQYLKIVTLHVQQMNFPIERLIKKKTDSDSIYGK